MNGVLCILLSDVTYLRLVSALVSVALYPNSIWQNDGSMERMYVCMHVCICMNFVCICCIYIMYCVFMYVLTSCTVHWAKKLQQPGKLVAGRSVMISYKQMIKLFLKINVSCVKEHELRCSVM